MVDSINAERWLQRAMIDLRSAEVNAEADADGLAMAICYSCHQAMEKGLKAVLLAHGQGLVRTHDLPFLVSRCIQEDAAFSALKEAAFALNDYAVDARYPSDFPDIYGREKAMNALNHATDAIKTIRLRLQSE